MLSFSSPKGPVLGPLVIGVAVIEKKDEEKLLDIGVKDSKQLTPFQRTSQLKKIKKAVKCFDSVQILAEEIDSLRDRKSLNEIEAMRIGALLNGLKIKPEVVYVDSPDHIMENFARRIKKYISFDCIIKSEHKADVKYPIVSAASILAKVERDNEIKKLAKVHGKIGSGYPSDEVTIIFLKKWFEKNNSLPSFSRKSWYTSQNIVDEKFQKKLFEFGLGEAKNE